MDCNVYLDKLVLQGKIFFTKVSMIQIRKAVNFLLEEIYIGYCSRFKFLLYRKHELFHLYHICISECVNKYDFTYKYGFIYFLKLELIKVTNKMLYFEFKIEEKKIPKKQDVDKMTMTSEKDYFYIRKKREYFLECMKSFTTKQLESFYLYHYKEQCKAKSFKELKLTKKAQGERLEWGYNKIRKFYETSRTNDYNRELAIETFIMKNKDK